MHVARRGKRVSAVLLGVAVTVGSGVRAGDLPVLARLLHGRQLQFLVVQIVRFLSSVSLPVVAGEFLVQMDTLGALLLARAEGAAVR